MPKSRDLTPKQKRFIAEYLRDLNATQACIRAGYSARNADKIGSQLLGHTRVAAAIMEKQTKREEKLDLSVERILREIARLAFSDVRALYDTNGDLKPPHEWPDDVAAAVSGLDVERRREGKGDAAADITTKKVKSWDKKGALEMLAKYRGLLTEKVEHSGKIVYGWETDGE